MDFAIAGAGIIGLSLALELHARGATVAILDTAKAIAGASTAAAGMLATDDPHNPPALHAFSTYSASLYDGYLRRLAALSGLEVPYQTDTTLQYIEGASPLKLDEHSVDPRQLSAAALAAVRNSGIRLIEDCRQIEVEECWKEMILRPAVGSEVHAERLVHASGAWFRAASQSADPVVFPRKGQMLRVRIPSGLKLVDVHRSATLYIVPRTHGPQAGTAIIGATEESAGFDLRVHQSDLDRLRKAAARIIPELANTEASPQIEAWAGLRPATRDLLPLLGKLPGSERQWVATGHYRNGILLTPGTAAVMSDLLEGRSPSVDLAPFSPPRVIGT